MPALHRLIPDECGVRCGDEKLSGIWCSASECLRVTHVSQIREIELKTDEVKGNESKEAKIRYHKRMQSHTVEDFDFAC